MRATSAAWAAVLAAMFMHGSLATAEAAPAQGEGGLHRYLLPRQARRERFARDQASTETSTEDTQTTSDPTNLLGLPVSLPFNPQSLIGSVFSKVASSLAEITHTEAPPETSPTIVSSITKSSESARSSPNNEPPPPVPTTTTSGSSQQISSRSDSSSPSVGFLGSLVSSLLNPITSDPTSSSPPRTSADEPDTSTNMTPPDVTKTETASATMSTDSARDTTRDSTSSSSVLVGLSTIISGDPGTVAPHPSPSASSASSEDSSSVAAGVSTGPVTKSSDKVSITSPESQPTPSSSQAGGLLPNLISVVGSILSPDQPTTASEELGQTSTSRSGDTVQSTSLEPRPTASSSQGGGLISQALSALTGLLDPSQPTTTLTESIKTATDSASAPTTSTEPIKTTDSASTATSTPGIIPPVPLLSSLLPLPGSSASRSDVDTTMLSPSSTGSSTNSPNLIGTALSILIPPAAQSTGPATTETGSSGVSSLIPTSGGVPASSPPTATSSPQGGFLGSILSGILDPDHSSTSGATTTTPPLGIWPPPGSTANSAGTPGVINATGSSPQPTNPSAILSVVASEMSSHIVSIISDNPDPSLSSALVSEFSSALSSAASSLVGTPASTPATATPPIPTSSMILPGGSTVSYTLTTSGSVVIPVPLPTTTSQLPSTNGTASLPNNATTPLTGTGTSSSPTLSPSLNATSGTPATSGNGTATITSSSSSNQSSGASINGTQILPPPSNSKTITAIATDGTATSSPISPTSPMTSAPIGPSSTSTAPNQSSTSASSDPTVTVISIVATATDNATQMSIPTSTLIFEPSPSSVSSTSKALINPTSTPPSSIPSEIPHLIQAPGGMQTKPPEETTLIQVAFSYGLNYLFVLNSTDTRLQMFEFLPQGIAHALSIDSSNVTMQALTPFDTMNDLGYITTLAQIFIPSNMVDQLRLVLLAPNSRAYSSQTPVVRTLMSLINPTIDIIPGANLDPGAPSTADPSGASTTQSAGGAPLGGDSSGSSTVNGSTVGVGVGAVAGAAVCSVAMMYVARRYRRRRQRHRRISSIDGMPQMRETSYGGAGAYWMSGANGRRTPLTSGGGSRNSAGSSNSRSVREQGISAPVMSENSLGWN